MLLEKRLPATNIKGVGEPRTCKTCGLTLIASVANFKPKKSKYTNFCYFNTECRSCENKRKSLMAAPGVASNMRRAARGTDEKRLAYLRNLSGEALELAKLREAY